MRIAYLLLVIGCLVYSKCFGGSLSGNVSAGGGGGGVRYENLIAYEAIAQDPDTSEYNSSTTVYTKWGANPTPDWEFTVPASGKVILRFSLWHDGNISGSYFQLRDGDGTTVLADFLSSLETEYNWRNIYFYLEGLTPDATQTYELWWKKALLQWGPTFPALIEIIEVP